MIKSLIERIPENALSGALQIPSPFYGDDRKSAPTQFEVIEISDKTVSFKPAQDSNNIAKAIAEATPCLKIFQDYFAFHLRKPIIGFQIPLTEERAYNPVMPTFAFDNHVFVSCVEDLAYNYKVKAKYTVFGASGERTFNYLEGTNTNMKRMYSPALGRETKVAVSRYPIFYDIAQKNRIDKVAALALEVLANQIEPVTSSRIAHELEEPTEKDWGDFKGNLSRVTGNNLFNEAVIVSGLSKVCLLDTKSQTGLSEREIYDWQPRDIGDITPEELVEAVRRIGVKETLLFYNCKQWSVSAFLEGLFSKKDINVLEL